MNYNFDKKIDRRNTDSKKWNNLKDAYGSEDLLPLWVADMDFESPREIKEALKSRIDHGVFGYPYVDDTVYESIIRWVKNKHNWKIKKEWIVFNPGVVPGLNISVRIISDEGDNILVQTPVYPPFFRVIENNNRDYHVNPLKFNGETYIIDFDDLKEKIDDKSKGFILCNPHNPVGRAWNEEELGALGEIAVENNLIIVSDEIHCDLTLKGTKHIPIATLSKELEDRTITLMSPAKTFNIPGFYTSFAIIPNEDLRNKFNLEMEKMEMGNVSIFGAVALEAAYSNGAKWLDEVMEYIEDNMDYAIKYINENIPEIKVLKPEATYLLWLDFRTLDKDTENIKNALLKSGKVILNDGRDYGQGGDGFFRLNVACPRSILEEGMERIKAAYDSLKK